MPGLCQGRNWLASRRRAAFSRSGALPVATENEARVLDTRCTRVLYYRCRSVKAPLWWGGNGRRTHVICFDRIGVHVPFAVHAVGRGRQTRHGFNALVVAARDRAEEARGLLERCLPAEWHQHVTDVDIAMVAAGLAYLDLEEHYDALDFALDTVEREIQRYASAGAAAGYISEHRAAQAN
jgi:hypothetical protein